MGRVYQTQSPSPERANRGLHPVVYRILVGVAVIWVLAAWILFSGSGYTGITLGVVTLFTIVIVVIPLALRGLWLSHPESHRQDGRTDSFRGWLGRDFDTWQSRISTRDALAGMLIPFGAVVLGAILIGIAFDIARP